MNICSVVQVSIRGIVLSVLFQQTAGASGLVYVPVNPSFGGNPGNGPMLMSIAQAQNGFTAPKPAPLSPLQRFNNSLQQAILNNLASQIKSSLFGTDGTTINPGTYDAVNYTVVVAQNADGSLTITTIDKTNGATATFDVSSAL